MPTALAGRADDAPVEPEPAVVDEPELDCFELDPLESELFAEPDAAFADAAPAAAATPAAAALTRVCGPSSAALELEPPASGPPALPCPILRDFDPSALVLVSVLPEPPAPVPLEVRPRMLFERDSPLGALVGLAPPAAVLLGPEPLMVPELPEVAPLALVLPVVVCELVPLVLVPLAPDEPLVLPSPVVVCELGLAPPVLVPLAPVMPVRECVPLVPVPVVPAEPEPAPDPAPPAPTLELLSLAPPALGVDGCVWKLVLPVPVPVPVPAVADVELVELSVVLLLSPVEESDGCS